MYKSVLTKSGLAQTWAAEFYGSRPAKSQVQSIEIESSDSEVQSFILWTLEREIKVVMLDYGLKSSKLKINWRTSSISKCSGANMFGFTSAGRTTEGYYLSTQPIMHFDQIEHSEHHMHHPGHSHVHDHPEGGGFKPMFFWKKSFYSSLSILTRFPSPLCPQFWLFLWNITRYES